tara:strand:- start:600 stop:1247 length:648 start_codon:yes stop_codon:yes gene_type:complete
MALSGRDSYAGQRLFVVATGPSLGEMDTKLLKRLDKEYTFGVSGLCAWAERPFHLDFYGLSEPGTIRRWWKMAKGIAGTGIISEHLNDEYPGYVVLNRHLSRPTWFGHFAGLNGEEELTWLAGANSPVYEVALQVAFFLGFQKVYLLGEDQTGIGHVYNGHSSHVPGHLSTILQSAETCHKVYTDNGRVLVNCSPNSAVTPIPYQPLEEVLGMPS